MRQAAIYRLKCLFLNADLKFSLHSIHYFKYITLYKARFKGNCHALVTLFMDYDSYFDFYKKTHCKEIAVML